MHDLEQKIEEDLPTVRSQTALDKVIKKASLMEHTLSGLASGYVTGLLVLNFGLSWLPFINRKQYDCIEDKMIEPPSQAQKTAHILGGLTGAATWGYTEAGIFILSQTFFGPIGTSVYLGAKVITNGWGYFHYKKRREKN